MIARFLRFFRKRFGRPLGFGRLVELIYSTKTGVFEFEIEEAGLSWVGSTKEYVLWYTYFFGPYESTLLRFMCERASSAGGGVLLDIGGNLGTTAIQCSSAFSKVHSFEPNPLLRRDFEQLVSINRIKNIIRHEVALGDHDGLMTLHVFNPNNSGTGSLLEIDVATEGAYNVDVNVVDADAYIKHHVQERVAAIKLDVQGFEGTIIRSLSSLIASNKPLIYVEVTCEETHAVLSRLCVEGGLGINYQIFTLERVGFVRKENLTEIDRGAWKTFRGDALFIPL